MTEPKSDVHRGDCLDILPTIRGIDLVLADMPYGTTSCAWDSVIDLYRLWPMLINTGAKTFIFTASQPFTSALVMSKPDLFKYSWVWKKNRATGHVHAKNKPMKIHEDVLVFSTGTTVHASQSKDRMIYNPCGLIELEKPIIRKRNDAGDNAVMAKRSSHGPTEQKYMNYPSSVIEFDIPMNDERLHETQKPVDLMEYLICTYSEPGQTVMDFCMGSGTTGIACQITDRNFIGIEKDEEIFNIAKKRLGL